MALQIQEQVPLAPLTTLRIGGPARCFASIRTEDELLEALAFAEARSLRLGLLGGGSNLLVPDEGFDGLVLHLLVGSTIAREEQGDAHLYRVDAGVDWDAFVLGAATDGAGGVECLAGIPGLTGACPIQNIGAYGQEIAQTIAKVRALDRQTGRFVELAHEDCGFGYRTSLFNTGAARDRYLVTRVDFRLAPGARPNLSYADLVPLRAGSPTTMDVYHAVRAIRARKGMLITVDGDPDTRSAGSFFKNPIVEPAALDRIARALALQPGEIPHWPAGDCRIKLPAAWLIEQAGFPKGFARSPNAPVGISTRHTLALTNRSGTATCADLLALRDHIAARVGEFFGVALAQEPVFLR